MSKLPRPRRRVAAGMMAAAAAATFVWGCTLQPRDVPALSDTVLCDIVAHRDSARDVRNAAADELDRRAADCDRLSAVLRRRQIDDLRANMRDDPENDTARPTYTDCVLSPICHETE